MAHIKKNGKRVLAGDRPLKGMSARDLDENLSLVHFEEGTFLSEPGKFWLYFTDEPGVGGKIMTGEFDMLLFPHARRFDWKRAPIKDVWKKSHTNSFKGSDHILGLVEGVVREGKIYVEMMSVRPGYKHNRINTIMVDALCDHWPELKLTFVDPTEEGYLFIRAYGRPSEVVDRNV